MRRNYLAQKTAARCEDCGKRPEKRITYRDPESQMFLCEVCRKLPADWRSKEMTKPQRKTIKVPGHGHGYEKHYAMGDYAMVCHRRPVYGKHGIYALYPIMGQETTPVGIAQVVGPEIGKRIYGVKEALRALKAAAVTGVWSHE